MSLIRIDHHPTRGQLTTFGVSWLLVFGAVGGVMLARGWSLPVVGIAWTLAVLVPVVGWIVPAAMRFVYVGMAYLALPIGLVVSYTVLMLVYYGVLTPTALLMRLIGYDPMQRRFDTEAESYWVARGEPDDTQQFFRQF